MRPGKKNTGVAAFAMKKTTTRSLSQSQPASLLNENMPHTPDTILVYHALALNHEKNCEVDILKKVV